MKKTLPISDCQIFVRAPGLVPDEQRRINEALFTAYEPLRLWLKERNLRGPFRKLLVTLSDQESAAQWHGKVSVAAGICEITEAVSLDVLRTRAGDHAWSLDLVKHALACVASATGWRSDELDEAVLALAASQQPIIHFFGDLAQEDTASGIRCEPWMAVEVGTTRFGVRVTDEGKHRDFVVVSKIGPLFLEDEFPVTKTIIRSGNLELLDKRGKTLAHVPITRRAET